MPFRNKVKKAMGRGSSSPTSTASPVPRSEEISRVQTPTIPSSGSESPVDRERLTIDPREIALTQVDSNVTIKKKNTFSKFKSQLKRDDPYKNWPEDIYKPHELPRAKYRRPVDPDHQQTLQSYSLRDAFANMKRRSFLSQCSPMGSRMASRRGSFSSRLGRSAGPSRNHSIVGVVIENDISESDVSDVSLPIQAPETTNNGRSAPIAMRTRGNTVTTTTSNTVPDLVQSSSIDSDDADSLFPSQPSTINQSSRPGGVIGLPVQNFSKPFDGDELTRALTRKLMFSAGQL